MRTSPDISSDAGTPVAIYDPFDFGTSTPWVGVEGTSISSPTWAGFIAVADQGRQFLYNEAPLDGVTQTLPALYATQNLPNSYNTYFHDIVTGNNGYSARKGYDLVTGIGSPRLQTLLPLLAGYGAATSASVVAEPPETVISGGFFGTAVQADTAAGNLAIEFQGTATISLTSGPGTLGGTTTVNFSEGVAVFDNLTLSTVSATPDEFQIVVNSGSSVLATLTTHSVVVNEAATPNVGVYYPLPLDTGIRDDVAALDGDADGTDDVYLVYSQNYELTNGQLLVQNTSSSVGDKVVNFISDDEFGTTAPIIDGDQSGRAFEIIGTNGTSVNLTVMFSGVTPQDVVQGLVIQGGLATDDGGLSLPNASAVGGALLIDGGQVGCLTSRSEITRPWGRRGTGPRGLRERPVPAIWAMPVAIVRVERSTSRRAA